eukprot:SAG11_NODE_810_length_7068_cov_2.906443_1_plen_230_part_10
MTGVVRRGAGRGMQVKCHVESFPSTSRRAAVVITCHVSWSRRILNGDRPLRNAVDRHHVRRWHHHEATFMRGGRRPRGRVRRTWRRCAGPRDGARKSILVRLLPVTLRGILEHAVVVPSLPCPCMQNARQSCSLSKKTWLTSLWVNEVEVQTISHLQQSQAGLDWHLVQQSAVVRVWTIGPILSPPMMTFSRKVDALQHVGAATDNESGLGSTNASSAAGSARFMLAPSE